MQLREQDFGNFQDPVKIKNDLAERNRFGRFYYRCVASSFRRFFQKGCGRLNPYVCWPLTLSEGRLI